MELLVHIAKLFYPLVLFLGLIAAILGFVRSKKPGYVVVATYFLLAFLSLTVGPRLYKLYGDKTITPDTQKRINEATEKAYREAIVGSNYIPYADTANIALPLGNLLLVFGIWLLAKKEKITNNSLKRDS